MDYSELDKVRRTTTPLQLDAVESFARGRLTRREFIKRGTVVGLSMASIFLVFTATSIARTFFIAAAMFGATGLYGYTTSASPGTRRYGIGTMIRRT